MRAMKEAQVAGPALALQLQGEGSVNTVPNIQLQIFFNAMFLTKSWKGTLDTVLKI